MLKKKIILSVIWIMVISLCSGCFSYRDMNRLLFATMVLLDKEDNHILFMGKHLKLTVEKVRKPEKKREFYCLEKVKAYRKR